MKVLVTADLPGTALDRLRQHHEVVVLPRPSGPTPDELSAAVLAHPDAAALLALLTVRVDETLLARLPSLKVVGCYSVGVDNVDLAAARARNVQVCNTPDVLTDATADLTWALLLAAARRVPEAQSLLRDGRWTAFEPSMLLGHSVAGRTLGVVGFGRIGQAVARRARGFDMTVLYTSPREVPFAGARRVSLDELLAASDVVTLHCPATPSTRHLLDASALRRMRPNAVLVNTARGPIVDEAALAEALHAGALGAVGLDVFEREPAVHPRLLTAPRAVLTPHIGSATHEAREAMARLAVEGILDVLAGRQPAHAVA